MPVGRSTGASTLCAPVARPPTPHAASPLSLSARRDAILATWMQWPAVGRSTIVCFLLGRDGLTPPMLSSLVAEKDEFGAPVPSLRLTRWQRAAFPKTLPYHRPWDISACALSPLLFQEIYCGFITPLTNVHSQSRRPGLGGSRRRI